MPEAATGVPVRTEVARDIKLDAARAVGGVGVDAAKAAEAESLRKRAASAQDLSEVARENQAGVEAWRGANGEAALDRNFGSQRDEKGERIFGTPGEQARWDRAVKADALIKLVGEKGIKLSEIKDSTQRAAVKSQMESFILSSLDADYYRGLTSIAQRDAYINGILQDRQFINRLRTSYAEHAKDTLQDPVKEALRRHQEAQLTTKSAEGARDRAQARLEGVKKAQDLYESGGDSAKRMIDLSGADARVKSLTAQVTSKQTLLTSLQNQVAVRAVSDKVVDRIDTLTTEMAGLNEQLTQAEQDAGELAILRDGGKGLSDKLIEAEAKFQEAEDVFLKAQLAETNTKGDLGEAQGQRYNLEEGYVQNWENLISKAAAEWHAERLAQVENAEEAHLADMSKKSTDKLTQQFGKYLHSRYYTVSPDGRLNKTPRSEANKNMLTADFRILINPNQGARTLAEQHIMAAGNAAGLSAEEIKLHLENADYMKAQTNEVARQVLGGYLRNGGKVNNQTWEAIGATDWGKELTEAALMNPAVKEKEEQLKATGELGADGFRGGLTKKKGAGLLAAIVISIGAGLFR